MEHYAAAKGALAAIIKGLAVEMGPFGVRANGPAAYLASDASKFHTGDVLVIDGGCIVRAP